jgi:hypothetical protein
MASWIQSVFYGGETCGIFSFFQSIGALIVAPSAILTLLSGAGAAIGAWFAFGGPSGPVGAATVMLGETKPKDECM